MTVALKSAAVVSRIIAIDNAPADVALNSDFVKYIQYMRDVDRANPRRLREADELLEHVGMVSSI